VLNTFHKDQLIIQNKTKCIAFTSPQTLKQKFIIQVELSELNGFLWDADKRILWTYGNDKRLRGWNVPYELIGSEGKSRVLWEWDKEKIFDVLDPKTLNKYLNKKNTNQTNHIIKSESEEESENENESKSKPNQQTTQSNDSYDDFKPPERSFKEDIQSILPSKNKIKEVLGQPIDQPPLDSEDENSAAKKYGLVKNNRIGNLAVSNSENDSQDDGNPLKKRRRSPNVKRVEKVEDCQQKGEIKVNEVKKGKEESESESDDDLTGWF
jgi:hypothetical protein